MKTNLIIGCGTIDNGNSYESMKFNHSHESIHPNALYDTLDFNPGLNPTHVYHLSSNKRIDLPTKAYQFIALERIPSAVFTHQAAHNVDHMLDDEGLLVWLVTGNRFSQFKTTMAMMHQFCFQSCIVSETLHLLIFSKLDIAQMKLSLLQHMPSNPYLKMLIGQENKRNTVLQSFDYFHIKDFDNRAFQIIDIVNNDALPQVAKKISEVTNCLTKTNSQKATPQIPYQEVQQASWFGNKFVNMVEKIFTSKDTQGLTEQGDHENKSSSNPILHNPG